MPRTASEAWHFPCRTADSYIAFGVQRSTIAALGRAGLGIEADLTEVFQINGASMRGRQIDRPVTEVDCVGDDAGDDEKQQTNYLEGDERFAPGC